VLTYSFVHGDIIRKAGLDTEDSYKIVNSLSPDLQYYRQTLTPGLLNLVHLNIKQGYEDFAIFEINKTHNRKDGLTDELVPVELDLMAAVVVSKRPKTSPAYYEAKHLVEYLAKSLNMSVVFRKIDQPTTGSLSKPFEYRRSAHIIDVRTGIAVGVVGEYRQSVIKSFKLPEHAAGFEFEMQYLFEAFSQNNLEYRPLSRYPGTDRDICFKVGDSIEYGEIYNAASQSLADSGIEYSILPVDIYKAEGGDTKNITIKIKVTPHAHTLNSEDITKIINDVVESVVRVTGAQVV
jgi:phenylalanyl-tRNA synthetase beta chain